MKSEIWLVRHGETEWSCTGRHTGRTDIGLTEHGREQAMGLKRLLGGQSFSCVLSSPLVRAKDTARLAGFDDFKVEPSLMEWDYGDLEGLTSVEIARIYPGWTVWEGPIPNGESIEEVAVRARQAIASGLEGAHEGRPIVFFAHGHLLRVLATQWLGIEAERGALLALSTASMSILSYEHDRRVISSWNVVSGSNERRAFL